MLQGNQPTVMSHDFAKVPSANIQRSKFDRSHGHKTTLASAGILYPILIDEALPGDTMHCKMAGFGRLATPIHPVMDNMFLETHFFAVPYRLIWDNFQKFMGEQINPGDSTDFLVPQITTPGAGYAEGSLYDHFGIPTKETIGNINNLFGRAYNKIYNDHFRDENLQNSVTVDTGDGPDSEANYQLLRRGKRHDYFTSSLPFAQKGDAAALPLGISAPITGFGMRNGDSFSQGTQSVKETGKTSPTSFADTGWSDNGANQMGMLEDPDNAGYPLVLADLTNATSATINELREAFAIQAYLERNARGGSRYTEIVLSHFGVHSPDARLQRAEYLGGGRQNLNMNPVAQTSETSGSPLATLSGVSTVQFQGHGFNKSFTEHSIIIGLVSIRADLTYQQGLERMHSRRTVLDHYLPVLAHLGEQAVLSKEIFADGTAADEDVFGYQERWAEYRSKQSQVTGLFRSNATGTLDSWHLSEDFSTRPTLNAAFIEDNPPIARVIAVPSEDHMIFDAFFRYHCDRPMPMNSIPGNIKF